MSSQPARAGACLLVAIALGAPSHAASLDSTGIDEDAERLRCYDRAAGPAEASSPFRESTYEPEAFVSFLTDYRVLGLRLRAASAGIVHQSNGRSQPLSRSWNRLYGEPQLVRGAFGLSVKPWGRIERGGTDDNPDIEDYLGRYELRYNTELSWSFPIAGRLRGLVQWYNGYGENLIDYNHNNNHRFGVGVLMSDWL